MASAPVPPPFAAYDGKDPYIFVSYAHADAEAVFAELVQLRQWGANLWYDEGIDPGNEWPEEIAEALDGSTLVIFYVTARSVASRNCRNELNYALDQNKRLLIIHLEETVLPRGVGLSISSIQAILKYRMDYDGYCRKVKDSLKDLFRDDKGTGAGIKVAIVSSGIECSHPGLGGLKLADDVALAMNEAQVVVNVPGNGMDVYGMGTALAGLVRERAPQATLGSFRVLNEKLGSKHVLATEGVLSALEAGYHIVIAGFGCPANMNVAGQYKHMVDRLYRRGVHLIASANNQYEADEEFPSNFSTVIGVSMAKQIPKDHIYFRRGFITPYYALGTDVETLWKNGSLQKATGTSYAAATVAGILASLLSKVGNCSPNEAQLLLEKQALPWTKEIGGANCAEFNRYS
jgi:subtilisin family serine protease